MNDMHPIHKSLSPEALLSSLLLVVICACLGSRAYAQSSHDTLIIVPHTHWEGAVFKTREEYLQDGLPHILKALSMLQRYPQYRYVLDQMAYVKPFLERYPNEVPLFKQMLEQHRLEIAGGTLVMEDENIPSAESLAHQFLLSKWYFRDRLGYEVHTGWGIDTFGHNAQMPQILRLAGMTSYWFSRGVASLQSPAELNWRAIDGTTIPAHWLPMGYRPFAEREPNFQNFEAAIRSSFDALSPFWSGSGRVLLSGGDVTDPDESLPPYIEQWNRTDSEPFSIQLGTPSDFEELRAKQPQESPVIVGGDLNPIFPGGYSTRIELKRWMRDMERTLTSAEKASVLAGRTSSSDREAIERAWDPTLFNQTHDLSNGVMLDHVYEDTLAGYRLSRTLGEEILGPGLDALLAHVDTQGPGMPLAVFNFSGWERSDYVETEVEFSQSKVRGIELQDSTGKAIAVQILQNRLNGGEGGLGTATIAFVARGVPAMGYAIYHVVPIQEGAPLVAPRVLSEDTDSQYRFGGTRSADYGTLENEYYKATVNLWTGEMTSLILKNNNWEVLSKSGNIVAREEDRGDFWELYGTLEGGRSVAEKTPIGLPRPDATQWSSNYSAGGARVKSGAAMTEFASSHPFGKNQFATRIRMYPGVQRIDIHTEIVSEEPFVRYRVLFPTTVHDGINTQEIAFGALERPRHQEFPAQNWADYSAKGRGLTILNRGLPGNNVTDDTMMVSLLRSTRLQTYGKIENGYDPAKLGSDTALELGERVVHDYALVPHAGSWQDAQVYRSGQEFNNPLVARRVEAHAGAMPSRWGWLQVSSPYVVLSALKPSRDGEVALRVYEAAGRAVQRAQVHFTLPVASVREANLIEDPEKPLQLDGNTISFNMHPYEIKTFRLRLVQ
jgi:alpha-mannosidase